MTGNCFGTVQCISAGLVLIWMLCGENTINNTTVGIEVKCIIHSKRPVCKAWNVEKFPVLRVI